MDAWPRLLEELRILTSSLGRSIPQALFEVGRRAPDELRPAFVAAHREWLLSTDFARTLQVLKAQLADPTADAVCETLLVAHEVGGTDLDRRLEALIDDRIQDTQGRKDARARQAGARFARRFVLIVPAGMALAGMSVGTGRAAYQTPTGQLLGRGRDRAGDRVLGVGRPHHGRSPRRSGCSMPRLLAGSCVLLCGGRHPRALRAALVQPPAARRAAAALRPGGLDRSARRGGVLSVASFREVIGPLARERRRAPGAGCSA